MSESKKNLIIIGAGITGLSAGLSLVKNVNVEERPVIICEKEPVVGGLVSTYKRKDFIFDTAQIIPDLKEVFEYLEIDIKLKQFKGYYARIFLTDIETGNVRPFKIPSSLQGFEYHLMNRFPKDTKKIKKFFNYTRKMYNELFRLKYNPGFIDKIRMIFTCRHILANSKKTFKDLYQKFNIQSEEIWEIFNVFAAFSGLPAERVAALLTVGAMHSTLKGAYRPEKGFNILPQEMKKLFLERGGQIKTKTKVKKILVEKGKVYGVTLENGEVIEADIVITTIDAKVAMKELLGIDVLKKINRKYAKKLENIKMSPSSIHIGLGLDDDINLYEMGLDSGYNILTTGGNTFEQLFEAFDLGKMAYSPNVFHCGVIIPSFTMNKKNTIVIRVVPVPANDWIKMKKENNWLYEKEKNDIADFFITLVEKYMIQGLTKHIVFKDVATPATFSRYSGSPTGSIYDMSSFPQNFGKKRLSMITPIKNLYQPKFSHGIWACMQAGLQVSDVILDGKIMNGYIRYRKEKK